MTLGGGAFGWWFVLKGGALLNGMTVLKQDVQESSLASSIVWATVRKHCKPGSGISPDTESAMPWF